MITIVVLHYPEVVGQNWLLMKKAARKLDVELISWEPHKIQFYCEDKKCYPLYDGQEVNPAVIIHRTIFPFSGVILPALHYWASTGTVVLNAPEFAYRSRDKLLTTIDLFRAGVSIVPTLGFIRSGNNDFSMLGGGQIIIKPAHGVRGEKIQFFPSYKDYIVPTDVSTDLLPLEHYIAQPFINNGGHDIRAFVVDGRCIAIMQRQARKGEIRANLAQGAQGKALALNHPASKIGVAALKACELDYGGVDMIEDSDGTIRVLEVDAWAGFAGITTVTGANVAKAIIDMAVNKLKEKKKK